MRQKIVAGNWKMNKDVHESMELLRAIQSAPIPEAVRVMIAPPTLFLDRMAEATQGHPLQVVSQNMNAAASGAFTGEISAEMLKSISIQGSDNYENSFPYTLESNDWKKIQIEGLRQGYESRTMR